MYKSVANKLQNHCIMLIVFALLQSCGGTSNLIPATECPQPPAESREYLIGAGDSLDIYVWGNPGLSGEVRVRPDGKISMPLVEDFAVAGKSPSALARDLELGLGEFVRSPKVNVEVSGEGSGNQVQIVGQVTTPKAVSYRVGLNVLDIVVEAGGLGEFAAGNGTKLIRNVDNSLIECRIRLDDLIKRGEISQNVELFPGDVIIVPEANF